MPADAKAVRMLIPELHEASVCFVATDDNNRVIGAAGATRTCRPQPPVGPGIALHVIEPCRRQGIGRRLLQCLERAAEGEGAHALYGASRVEQGSDAMRAWQWLGFTSCEKVESQQLPLDQFEPRLAPLVERMQNQNRIPAAARIIPLYESNKAAVLNLHLDNLGGDRADLYRKLCGRGPGAFHPRYSRVLLVDGKVVGCILAYRKDSDTAIVDADIVDSSLRGGWANVWLKLEATRGALRLGIKNFEFTSFDHYTDTRSFTKKMGGVTTRTTLLMVKPLAVQSREQGEQ
jgi:N-acetylglutamate synthase-like GNAT family acetyltransferase